MDKREILNELKGFYTQATDLKLEKVKYIARSLEELCSNLTEYIDELEYEIDQEEKESDESK